MKLIGWSSSRLAYVTDGKKSRVYASKGPLLIHWEGQATPHPQGGGMVSLPRKSLLEKSSQWRVQVKKKIWMGKKPIAEKLDSLLLASSKLLDRTINKVCGGGGGVIFISSHLCLWRHPPAIIYIYISLIKFQSEYPDKKFREAHPLQS